MNFKEKINPVTTVKAAATSIPRVGILSDALMKMFIYVQECSDEIGWLGTVQALESGRHFIIDDVFLFDQQVHGATTEITPQGLASFGEELLAREDGFEIWNRMQMWGHSHVNMGITPSGQDDKQMDEFAQIGHDFFIRLICNKKGEMKLDFFNYKTGVVFIDVPWEIMATGEEEETLAQIFHLQEQLRIINEESKKRYEAEIKEEMKLKVRKFSNVALTTRNNDYENEFGFYSNGVWTRRTEQEKIEYLKKKHLTTSRGTNASQNMTRDIKNSGSTKKNIKGEGDSGFEFIDSNVFASDDEVRKEFTADELLLLSSFLTFEDLDEELDAMGYLNLTDDDVESVMRVAIREAMIVDALDKKYPY
jgi:hypothetical protein